MFQTNPVRVGLFSYVKNFFCSHKICMDAGHAGVEYTVYQKISSLKVIC